MWSNLIFYIGNLIFVSVLLPLPIIIIFVTQGQNLNMSMHEISLNAQNGFGTSLSVLQFRHFVQLGLDLS